MTTSDTLSGTDRWNPTGNRLLALLRERGPRGVIAEIRARGLRQSFAYAARRVRYSLCIIMGRHWDSAHGVETGGHIELDRLQVVGGNKALGAPAVSTSPSTFRHLARFFPAERSGLTYVDIGAGKGRTLFLAALNGFHRVIGVEFSTELCARAQANIDGFRKMRTADTEIAIVQADATQCALPEGDLVLYFGNPFALDLWPAMINHLLRSLDANPRNVTIVIAGSQKDTIRGAGRLLALRPEFVPVASGRAPYYLDTYLPYYFECFRTLRAPLSAALRRHGTGENLAAG
jgi:SAM-dependent methyltransferase